MKKVIFLLVVSLCTMSACKQDSKAVATGSAENVKFSEMKQTYNAAMKNMEKVHEMQVEFKGRSRKLAEESNLQKLDPNVQYTLGQLNKAEFMVAMWGQRYSKVEVDTVSGANKKQEFLANAAIELDGANTQVNMALDVCKKVLAGENVMPEQK
jgi:hypothetical protein